MLQGRINNIRQQHIGNIGTIGNYRSTPIHGTDNPEAQAGQDDAEFAKRVNTHFADVSPDVLNSDNTSKISNRKLHIYDPSTRGMKHFDLSDEDVDAIRNSTIKHGNITTFSHIPDHIKSAIKPLPLDAIAQKHHELYNKFKDFNQLTEAPTEKSHHPYNWIDHRAEPYFRGESSDAPEKLNNKSAGDYARMYTSTLVSRDLNTSLINNHINNFKNKIKNIFSSKPKDTAPEFVNKLKQGMNATPLDKPLTVYSGTSFDPSKTTKNSIMHAPAFTSSSIDPSIAHHFGDGNGPDGSTHIMQFNLPKGYNKGAYIQESSKHSNEFEYLMHPDQKFRYMGSRKGTFKVGSEKRDVTYHQLEPVEE